MTFQSRSLPALPLPDACNLLWPTEQLTVASLKPLFASKFGHAVRFDASRNHIRLYGNSKASLGTQELFKSPKKATFDNDKLPLVRPKTQHRSRALVMTAPVPFKKDVSFDSDRPQTESFKNESRPIASADSQNGTREDYLFSKSYYARPKEVQPYCHVPKGRAGQLMGWRKAQKESLAWEAKWDPPIIHHALYSQIQNRHTPKSSHPFNPTFIDIPKGKTPKKKPSIGDFVLPSITESAQPYPYPERQEITHIDDDIITRLLATPRTVPLASRQTARLMTAKGFPSANQDETVRSFVVNGTASAGVLDIPNELDLKLQICELFLEEKSLFNELERMLKKEDIKDQRTRKQRRKHVIRMFRRLHERVVKLVESQPADQVSKTRQLHMDRFLEASGRNLIFLRNFGDNDPWPEMAQQLSILTSILPQLITI